jgi:hypothetical protein
MKGTRRFGGQLSQDRGRAGACRRQGHADYLVDHRHAGSGDHRDDHRVAGEAT